MVPLIKPLTHFLMEIITKSLFLILEPNKTLSRFWSFNHHHNRIQAPKWQIKLMAAIGVLKDVQIDSVFLFKF